MTLLHLHRQIVISRNEGKIKTYGSCTDLRAWSHDSGRRDRYLREWIKNDMPVSIIPTTTLICFFRTMTNKCRGKVTPRCHPNCKSKVVLESICSTCSAMKECLKKDESLGKYFEDEEFETCHWPCERCLEALKCIKMFWRIIVEKVFHVSVPKKDDFTCCSSTVRNTAQMWQSEMIQHAYFVKNLAFGDGDTPNAMKEGKRQQKSKLSTVSHPDGTDLSSVKLKTFSHKSNQSKPDESPACVNRPQKRRKVSRYITVKVKTGDVVCQTSDSLKETEESGAYKNNLNYLQQRFNIQKTEIERLKKENNSLKIELQNYCYGFSVCSHLCSPSKIQTKPICIIPKPFDEVEETSLDYSTDSEMVITMKNCSDTKYTNVSLLQVLHKSNDPSNTISNETGCSKQDPTVLLEKMHGVLGDIVRREISLVNDSEKSQSKITKADASFHKVVIDRSSQSCISFMDAN